MAFYYMIPALANMYAAVFLPCREIDKSLGETISYMSVDLNVECGSDVHTATQMTALSGFVIVIPMCVGLSYYPWISSVSKIIEERPGRSGVKPMIDFAITQEVVSLAPRPSPLARRAPRPSPLTLTPQPPGNHTTGASS